MPPTPEPPRPKNATGNPLTRKLGPAPVYVWLAAVVVVYVAYRHFAGASSSTASPAATASDGTGATTTNGSGGTSDNGAGGGGGASPVDSLSADLLSQLFGDTAAINNNLTTALLGSEQSLAGVGQEAIDQNGALAQETIGGSQALQQAILDSYTPAPTPATVATSTTPGAVQAPYVPGTAAPAPATPSKIAASPSYQQIVNDFASSVPSAISAPAAAKIASEEGPAYTPDAGQLAAEKAAQEALAALPPLFSHPSSAGNVKSQAAPVPLSTQGAKKTGTNPKTAGTLH